MDERCLFSHVTAVITCIDGNETESIAANTLTGRVNCLENASLKLMKYVQSARRILIPPSLEHELNCIELCPTV